MAAYTANTTGNWNSATTWSGAGIPGSGDTGTINAGVTVTIPDGYTATIGATGQATGYTALTIANTGKLIIGGGASGELDLHGDVICTAGSASQFVGAAGSTLKYLPASGQRIKVQIGAGGTIQFNGTSGARCAILTDATALSGGGLKGYIASSGSTASVTSMTYTDCTDLGDGSTNGFMYSYNPSTYTLDRCTFTRCEGVKTYSTSASVTYSITNNVWESSVGTNYGSGSVISNFSFSGDRTSGTRTITGNVFDLCLNGDFRDATVQYNSLGANSSGVCLISSSAYGKKWITCDSNLCWSDTSASGTMVFTTGDLTNNLIICGGAANPHYTTTCKTVSSAIKNNIFASYNSSNDGAGDCITTTQPTGGAILTSTITGNIILPVPGANKMAGTLITGAGASASITATANNGSGLIRVQLASTANHYTGTQVVISGVSGSANANGTWTITLIDGTHYDLQGSTYDSNGTGGMEIIDAVRFAAEHNTAYMGSQTAISVDETGTEAPGQLASVKANWFHASALVTNKGKIADSGHATSGGPLDIGSPSNLDYNGSYNCFMGPQSGNTYTYAGNGYQMNLSAAAGVHDLADQDPQFVDVTRSVANWWISLGNTTSGSTITDTHSAITYINGDLANRIPACMAWIRAGFAPQNAALRAASYPGDTSTVDAAGTTWPGGAPGIGAMAYQASGNRVRQIICMGD